MNKDTLRQVANVAALVVTLVVNALANALPLNGQTTGEISDRFRVLFVPAGYVFSIWGLIYLGLIAFTIYQALPGQRENPRLHRIGYLFALASLANSVWIFLWHYEAFILTVIAMLTLLLSLIAIYLRLDIGRARVSAIENWVVNIPFSIYLGWITVATVANVTAVLAYLNWNGFGISQTAWAVAMLVIAAGIAFAMVAVRSDLAYVLVIIWAFVGIAVKQAATSAVAITVALLIVALALVVGVSPRSRWSSA
ncbi:MAG: tryptophan-rich sensory protein [Anaerolineae bacterium]